MKVTTGFGYFIKDGLKESKYEIPIGEYPDPLDMTFVEVKSKEELDNIVLDKMPLTDEENKRLIFIKLQQIDLDSIRPLRNNEVNKLVELENKAVILRQELASIEIK